MTLITQALRSAAQVARSFPHTLIGGTFAINEFSRPVNPKHPDAVCFCALGRLYQQLPDDIAPPDAEPEQVWNPLHALLTERVVDDIYTTNDATENVIEYDHELARRRVGLNGIVRMEELANELEANTAG